MPDEFPAITSVIPHRPPMLFISRIIELDPGKSGMAEWDITGEEWWLPGHFPGMPLNPGFFTAEALAQLTAYVVGTQPEFKDRWPLLQSGECRFPAPVLPGSVVHLVSTITQSVGRSIEAECQAFVGDRLVARLNVTALSVTQKMMARIVNSAGQLSL